MRILVLSRAPRCYSTRRLVEAAQGRGHKVRVLDTTLFSLLLEHGRPTALYKGGPLPGGGFDAVIPRIGASVTFFGTVVVRQFESMGVFCLNGAEAILNSRDKLRTLQLLSRHDIGIPPTSFVRCNDYIAAALESVGGAPVVVKLLEGTQGVGVILAEDRKNAESIVETLRTAKQNVLIQRFVAESKGRDVRALVVGDRVVAAMRRTAQGGEFRSNVHRGGRAKRVRLDPLFEETALRAARVVGLHVAGVDMLEGKDGPQVSEVNSSPGLEGIEGSTGTDVAGEIIAYLEHAWRERRVEREASEATVAKGLAASDVTAGRNGISPGREAEPRGGARENARGGKAGRKRAEDGRGRIGKGGAAAVRGRS